MRVNISTLPNEAIDRLRLHDSYLIATNPRSIFCGDVFNCRFDFPRERYANERAAVDHVAIRFSMALQLLEAAEKRSMFNQASTLFFG